MSLIEESHDTDLITLSCSCLLSNVSHADFSSLLCIKDATQTWLACVSRSDVHIRSFDHGADYCLSSLFLSVVLI